MTSAEPLYWSEPRKIALRFFLLFFVLYIFFNPNGVLPYIGLAYDKYIQPFYTLMIWLAANVLRLSEPVTISKSGSGDTMYDYVIVFFITVVAGIGSFTWSLVDRKTRNYNNLFYWLTVVVRYYVAITMIAYGSVKIIKLQFPGPSPDRLLQPLGTMSPMGLAWTYMGYSSGFNYFTGFGELICGLLLFFRRTAILGAILGVVVAGNIMAVNYCFDVPVKLLSTMLTAMCLFLLSKDIIRLTNFFILNKVAQPANLSPHTFKKQWKNITAATVKYLLIAYVLFFTFYQNVKAMDEYGDAAKKPPLYGIYDVQSFVRNKDTIPPLTIDTIRWRKLVISYPGSARIKMMNDSTNSYKVDVDTVRHTIVFDTYAHNNKAYFTYELNKGDLLLKGSFEADSLRIKLKKYDLNNFLLIKRGFHWVNEKPFNR